MRSLKFTDVFTVSRILKKMQIKPNFSADHTQESLGAEIIIKFFENLGDAEEEVTSFLADLKGMSKEDFQKLSFEESAKVLQEFKEMPGLKGFLDSVTKLMK